MSLTIEEVEKIAHLARIDLTDEQKESFRGQLSAILDYAEMLNELDIADVEPTSSAVPLRHVVRADVVTGILTTDEILTNAPKHQDNQFVIQAVLDDGD